MSSLRLPQQSGIAIGPILFILALLALIGGIIAAGGTGFGTASVTDRTSANIAVQAQLIRTKINECSTKYDGTLPDSGGTPISVATVTCPGDPVGQQNLWSGIRPSMLPTSPNGFGDWMYISTATGGDCIYVIPTISNPVNSAGIVAGLSNAANKFTSGTHYSSSNEVIYDPASSSQKFILWISLPTGTPDSHCLP